VGEQGGVWLVPALLFYTSKSIPFQTDSSIILLFNQIEIAHILIHPNKIYINLYFPRCYHSIYRGHVLRCRLVFEYIAKYSRVLVYSSSFHVWFSIRRVSKYWY
jgi:hypothetical protein